MPDKLEPAQLAAEDLLEHAPCGLLVTSLEGMILRANATFCRWMGYGAGELVGQRRLQDLMNMGGRIFHQTHLLPLLQMQNSIAEVKLDMVHRQGHSIPIMMNAVRHADGPHPRHEIALFIAEERSKYERELLLARQRAEELAGREQQAQLSLMFAQAEIDRQRTAAAEDRARFAEQMVGIVSHDLRNPLSVVKMSAFLLQRGDLTASQRTVIGRINSSVGRAERLIADLLDFTKARIGQGLSVSLAPIALHTLVKGSVEELAAAYPQRQLLHRQAGAGACRADADRLAQLIGNLVSNAMSYGAPDRPVVVTSSILEGGFEISVRNEGNPIPPELRAALFEPMVRGSHSSAAADGVGLGLFIVNEISRAHQGRVSVESSASDGTTFRAWFPAP